MSKGKCLLMRLGVRVFCGGCLCVSLDACVLAGDRAQDLMVATMVRLYSDAAAHLCAYMHMCGRMCASVDGGRTDGGKCPPQAENFLAFS